MAIKIFDTWQKNSSELNKLLKVTEWSANTTAASLGLAIALGVANPAVGITAAGLAFVGPIREVIERIVSKSEKNLSLEEVVAIAAPLAYLRSFDNWTKQNTILKEIINQDHNQVTEVDSRIVNLTLDRDLASNSLRSFQRMFVNKKLSSKFFIPS